MRKAILPLLLIITMVLSASVATARDYTASGNIDGANGWAVSGDPWQQTIEDGVFTEGASTASHPVATGASGQFDYMVSFQIKDTRNTVKAGLIAGGHEYAIEYKSGKFWFNGVALGSNTAGPTSTQYAHIWSEDSKVWHAMIYGMSADATVNAAPTAVTIGGADNTGAAAISPVIYTLNFDSPGEPAAPVTETPAVGMGSPPASIEEIQDYYDNIYPTLYGSQANYLSTPATTAATTGASGFTVSGSVTSAANGNPIEGASVVIGDRLQKTDSLGKFKLEGIASGNADVAVSADGYAAKTESINVDADKLLTFILDSAATGGAITAGAANETKNETAAVNATIAPTMEPTMAPATAPTAAPSATQTKSPGFEGIIAAIAMIGAAGVLVYVNRKR